MDIFELGRITVPEITHVLSRTSERFTKQFYGNEIAQEIIHSSEKYDAIMMESYFTQEPVSALIHKFGCVGIEVSTIGDSVWINELAGKSYVLTNAILKLYIYISEIQWLLFHQ